MFRRRTHFGSFSNLGLRATNPAEAKDEGQGPLIHCFSSAARKVGLGAEAQADIHLCLMTCSLNPLDLTLIRNSPDPADRVWCSGLYRYSEDVPGLGVEERGGFRGRHAATRQDGSGLSLGAGFLRPGVTSVRFALPTR